MTRSRRTVCIHMYNIGYSQLKEKRMQDTRAGIRIPRGFRLVVWSPSISRILPGPLPNPRDKLNFVLLWIFAFLLRVYSWPTLGNSYRVFLVFHGQEIASRTVVTGKTFLRPFMGKNDLEVGSTLTESKFRRMGLAYYTVENIFERYARKGRKMWCGAAEDNVASRAVIQRLGFHEYCLAIERKILVASFYSIIRGPAERKGREGD